MWSVFWLKNGCVRHIHTCHSNSKATLTPLQGHYFKWTKVVFLNFSGHPVLTTLTGSRGSRGSRGSHGLSRLISKTL
jgi:hypothetical protein